jgi:hypothetical protein
MTLKKRERAARERIVDWKLEGLLRALVLFCLWLRFEFSDKFKVHAELYFSTFVK